MYFVRTLNRVILKRFMYNVHKKLGLSTHTHTVQYNT